MSQERPRNDGVEDERPPLSDALTAFAQGLPRSPHLARLSDLDRQEARDLTDAWPLLPVATREAIVRGMDELAESNFALNFGRALRVALDDGSPVVRQLAVAALWEDDQADLLARYLVIARRDPSVDVRAAAVRGLTRFAGQGAAGDLDEATTDELRQLLLALADDEREPEFLRRRALEAIGVFGQEPRVRELIRSAYESDQEGLRAGALSAMGSSCDHRWLDVVLAASRSPDAEIRYEAARACGTLGDDRAVPELVELADDHDVEVRHAAIAGLGALGSKAASNALRGLGAEARESDRELIEEALDEATLTLSPLRAAL